MTQRVYNFSPGPAVLPESVLAQAQRDMLALPGAGASVMEIGHRSKAFREILEATEANLRHLLDISDDYAVLFLQGGSRLQFSMIPMNLLTSGQPSADYLITGSWGAQALKEARKHGEMRVAWNGSDTNYDRVPTDTDLTLNPDAAYFYYTSNETIQGVQFGAEPEVSGVPLVCDASSDFLCRPLQINRYGLIYACAQKNAGPAGVTIVVLRKKLLDRCRDELPIYMNFKQHADAGSLMNTAPTFAIYMVRLVTDWLVNEIGGLDKMYQINEAKAKMLYDVIDSHADFYQGHARIDDRSMMNVTFRLPSDELTKLFLAQAEEHDLASLAGHRTVGGIRASIYNAMPVAGVEALRDFMIEFCNRNS